MTIDQMRATLGSALQPWKMVSREQLENILCGPSAVPPYGEECPGKWNTVLDEQQLRHRKYVVQCASKAKLVRYRRSYRLWQYTGR